MPVIPNDPPISLWVLKTVPRERTRAAYGKAIRDGLGRWVSLLVLFTVVIVQDLLPPRPHPSGRQKGERLPPLHQAANRPFAHGVHRLSITHNFSPRLVAALLPWCSTGRVRA
jgi:hypothetical protein